MNILRTFLSRYLGLTLLGIAILASLTRVVANSAGDYSRETTMSVLRIGHWQLEQGYREALASIIEDYQKLHPNVRIEQIPMTERLYGPWLTTHLISGSAPDICEWGMTRAVYEDQYIARYFSPVTADLQLPNPYNVGTGLEGIPWRDTFSDGGRGGFRESMQDYYSILPTLYDSRLFVNKTLLRRATGSDELPQTFAKFIDACASVRELGKREGLSITPVVSCYGQNFIFDGYRGAFTSAYESELDLDFSGDISKQEMFAGFLKKQLSMSDPRIKALFALVKEVCDQMPDGFAGMDRQEAMFRFLQGKAVFLSSGSWDARTLVEQSKGKFEVTVIDYPLPAKGERYGEFISGKTVKDPNANVSYAVYKMSKHRDQAVDFLKYLTSRDGNAKFAARSDWPPSVIGSEPTELMKPFMPDPVGFKSRLDWRLGNFVGTKFSGEFTRFLSGETDYANFSSSLESAILNPQYGGKRFWSQEYDKLQRLTRSDERLLASQSAVMTLGEISPGSPERYRLLLQRQIFRNNAAEQRYWFKKVTGKELPAN